MILALKIISIVVAVIISVKVFSDIASNRLERYVGICSAIGFLCMVYAALVGSMLLEYHVFDKVSELRWVLMGSGIIIFQSLLICILGNLKASIDEENFEECDYELFSEESAKEKFRSQCTKRDFRRIK